LVGLYTNPASQNLDEKRASQEFIDFYEDIFDELNKYGEIEELNVCDNVCEHMIGNVYVKYRREEETDKALKALTGRFYGGKNWNFNCLFNAFYRKTTCS
jgi:splicing factor U2AF subunit